MPSSFNLNNGTSARKGVLVTGEPASPSEAAAHTTNKSRSSPMSISTTAADKTSPTAVATDVAGAEEDLVTAMLELSNSSSEKLEQKRGDATYKSRNNKSQTNSSDEDNQSGASGNNNGHFVKVDCGNGLELLAPSPITKDANETGDQALMILAASIPPGPDINMTDEDRLEKLAEYLESVGENRSRIANWSIGWSKNRAGVPFFVTEAGFKLKNKAEVAEYLDLPAMSMKMAEMVDYMDERHLSFTPSEWRVDERRKIDGRRTGFSFVSKLTGKTFYARNRIAEYLETYKTQPIRRVKKRSRKDEASGGESSGSEDNNVKKRAKQQQQVGATMTTEKGEKRVLSKKKKKFRKVGDAVVVDYEGIVYDALIVPTPSGQPAFDPGEDERVFSIFYIQEECFEHSVLESRIIRERPLTKTDQSLLKEFEKHGEILSGAEKDGKQKKLRMANTETMGLKNKPMEGTKVGGGGNGKLHSSRASLSSAASAKLSKDEDKRKSVKEDKTVAAEDQEPKSETHESAAEKAQAFLTVVRNRIESSMPNLFKSFISMMTEYYRGRLPLSSAIDFMVDAFGEDDTDIVMNFNQFLPAESRITPSYIRKRLAHLISTKNAVPNSELQESSTMFPSATLLPTTVASLGFAPVAMVQSAPSPPPMSYETFLNLVANRFAHNSAVLDSFKHMVARYLTEQDPSRLANDAQTLFAGELDLLQGLNTFLPQGAKISV